MAGGVTRRLAGLAWLATTSPVTPAARRGVFTRIRAQLTRCLTSPLRPSLWAAMHFPPPPPHPDLGVLLVQTSWRVCPSRALHACRLCSRPAFMPDGFGRHLCSTSHFTEPLVNADDTRSQIIFTFGAHHPRVYHQPSRHLAGRVTYHIKTPHLPLQVPRLCTAACAWQCLLCLSRCYLRPQRVPLYWLLDDRCWVTGICCCSPRATYHIPIAFHRLSPFTYLPLLPFPPGLHATASPQPPTLRCAPLTWRISPR